MRIPSYIRISRKCTGPVTYGHVVIPPNTSICMAITLLANDNLRFGQPDKFIPERWLGDSIEAQEARARYPSFGFGPRTCMGRECVSAVLDINSR